MENQETFWVIWREGNRAPVVKHENFEQADREAIRLAKKHRGHRFFVMSPVNVVRYVETDPIKRVWEKWRHMDTLLSDRLWIDHSDPEERSSSQRRCLFDCWAAIKESQKGREEK